MTSLFMGSVTGTLNEERIYLSCVAQIGLLRAQNVTERHDLSDWVSRCSYIGKMSRKAMSVSRRC